MALLAFYGLAGVDESSPAGPNAAGVVLSAGAQTWSGSAADALRWPGVRVSDVIGPSDLGDSIALAGGDYAGGGVNAVGADEVGAGGVGAGAVGANQPGGRELRSRDPRLPGSIPVVRSSDPSRPPAPTTTARPTVRAAAPPKAKATTTTTKPTTTTTKPTTTTTTTIPPNQQEGAASWYEAATPGNCAHRSIAMGTVVTVINVENGLRVTCRVNDRGPFIEGRVIDLSRSDFESLAHSGRGVVPVRLEWR